MANGEKVVIVSSPANAAKVIQVNTATNATKAIGVTTGNARKVVVMASGTPNAEKMYFISGGPTPPGDNFIITEGGDFLITEAGDFLITET